MGLESFCLIRRMGEFTWPNELCVRVCERESRRWFTFFFCSVLAWKTQADMQRQDASIHDHSYHHALHGMLNFSLQSKHAQISYSILYIALNIAKYLALISVVTNIIKTKQTHKGHHLVVIFFLMAGVCVHK